VFFVSTFAAHIMKGTLQLCHLTSAILLTWLFPALRFFSRKCRSHGCTVHLLDVDLKCCAFWCFTPFYVTSKRAASYRSRH
jgi:hypothetical protein